MFDKPTSFILNAEILNIDYIFNVLLFINQDDRYSAYVIYTQNI